MADVKDETVTITVEEYNSLKKDRAILRALEAGGVDNWEWYEDSLAGILDGDSDN